MSLFFFKFMRMIIDNLSKKITLLLFVIHYLCFNSISQELISSTGKSDVLNNGHSLSWSIGELVVVTGNLGANVFNQGFNQPNISKLESILFFPNMFSPNWDGINDNFKFYGEGLAESISFKIFNRLGNVVYQTNSLLNLKNYGWDGSFLDLAQPDGVYVWTLEANYLNGQPVLQKEFITGTILLNH
jgi:gliding motility-associated-like protein